MPSDELTSETALPGKCLPFILLLFHVQGMTKKKRLNDQIGVEIIFFLMVCIGVYDYRMTSH